MDHRKTVIFNSRKHLLNIKNRRQPSIECLYEIAEILNVEVKELLIERIKHTDDK